MQTFTGKQYLQIDIANNFGLDKKTWTERLDWFEQHQDHLPEMIHQAEEPALFFAGVQAYQDVLAGLPIGYPISLDATSSGLQILAALTGDRSAAELCNVVSSPSGDKREDAYTAVYESMLAQLGESAKIKREDTKQAIMTSLYGSTAVPKQVFGEGILLTTFMATMKELAPAAWELNETFLAIWDDEALTNDWTLPDNFHVHVKVMAQEADTVNFLHEPFDVTRRINAPTKEGRSLGANTIHSIDGMIVREITRRCNYDPSWIQLVKDILEGEVISHFATTKESKEADRMVLALWNAFKASGYLSARILDYLDSETIKLVDENEIKALIASLPVKPFKVISIHDCFRVLPQYGNDLRKQYNNQLYLIAKSNMLGYVLSQLVHQKVEVNKLDETLAQEILNSEYALS